MFYMLDSLYRGSLYKVNYHMVMHFVVSTSTKRSQDRDSCCMAKDSYPPHCFECIPASSKSYCTATHSRMSN